LAINISVESDVGQKVRISLAASSYRQTSATDRFVVLVGRAGLRMQDPVVLAAHAIRVLLFWTMGRIDPIQHPSLKKTFQSITLVIFELEESVGSGAMCQFFTQKRAAAV